MRALTIEEAGWVAGGDAVGNEMISVGETMIIWSQPASMIPRIGSPVSKAMAVIGVALVAQGQKRNQNNPGPGVGGSGGGDGGGSGGIGPDPGSGGGGGLGGDGGSGGGSGGSGGQTTCHDKDGTYVCVLNGG